MKFNTKTPGHRSGTDEVVDTDEVTGFGNGIMGTLGGKGNISEIDNRISRLRLVLKGTSIVSDVLLERTSSLGITKVDRNNIQVVYSTKAEKTVTELKRAVRKGVVLCRSEQKGCGKISRH